MIQSDFLHVYAPGAEGTRLSLFCRDALDDAIWRLALCALDEGLGDLFAPVCGRCGACCERLPVPVRAAEIRAMRSHLGMGSDEEFRRKHLGSADTWNEYDGFLKRRRGACPFLKRARPGKPASCAVYPVRPEACRAQAPRLAFCRKEPSKLFERLESITLEGGGVSFAVQGERRWELSAPSPRLKAALEECLAALGNVTDTRDERVRRVVSDTHAMLDDLLASPALTREKLEEVRGLLFNVTRWLALRPADSPASAELWEKYRRIEMLSGEGGGSAADDGRHGGGPLLLFPTFLVVLESGDAVTLRYSEYPELLEAAGDLVRTIALRYCDDLQEALTEPDPPCTLCGECCAQHKVEVTAYDVEHLAEHMGISEETFRRRYARPTPFSWNKGRVVLRQRDGRCIFLGERGEGVSLCGIYARRPVVCRVYKPRSRLCMQMNLERYWHRRVANVASVLIDGGDVLVTTENTKARGWGPVRIREEAATPLGAQLRRLRRLCAELHARRGGARSGSRGLTSAFLSCTWRP